MQTACDAAALAASQELTAIAWEAGENGSTPVINEQALAAAKQVAADIANHNGVFVDPARDVAFGKRYYDTATGGWPIAWGVQPFNVVKVHARRDQPNLTAPDGKLPLSFGWAVGRSSVDVKTSATAFVESRDMVLVLDFSGSMNDDSTFSGSSGPLGLTATVDALDDMWDALIDADPKWPGTEKSKFQSRSFFCWSLGRRVSVERRTGTTGNSVAHRFTPLRERTHLPPRVWSDGRSGKDAVNTSPLSSPDGPTLPRGESEDSFVECPGGDGNACRSET